MKKITIALALLLGLTGTASALELEGVTCNTTTGMVIATYNASAFDTLYHKHLLIVARGTNGEWKTQTFPLNYTYGSSTIDQPADFIGVVDGLDDIVYWNIRTDKTTLSIGACANND